MKYAVIGATGYVGNAVVRELAARGHAVTAFARHTDKVFAAPNVQAVKADVHDADFAAQLAGFDAVVSAFSPGWDNPHFARDFTAAYAAIVAAAQTAQVPYLLVIGGAGSLLVDGVALVDTPDFPLQLFAVADAERNLWLDLCGKREVNWAFLAPPLRFGEDRAARPARTGRYRLGTDTLLLANDGSAGIGLADLAVAIADDVERKAHLHQHFTVAAV